MCALSHLVGQLRLLRVMHLMCAQVMMNGCLVCWFYGVLVGHYTHGRQACGVGLSSRGQTEVMYSYWWSHSLPVIQPI